MSSREQIYVLETVKAMKKKIARDAAIESDSDSEIQRPTNRGNKLKKNAKFVHEGKLGPPTGPAVYKEVVEHSGYRRAIISRNPPLIDEEGYDIDSDDDDDRIQDAVAAAAEADPYSSIHLEQLLAPLTSVTDLPTHPTLSRPFTSAALTELANQGCDLMHKENAALSKVRPLLTKLSGDHTWANCEMFLSSIDSEMFDDKFTSRMLKRKRRASQTENGNRLTAPRINGDSTAHSALNGISNQSTSGTSGTGSSSKAQDTSGEDVTMTDGVSKETTRPEKKGEAEERPDEGAATNPHKESEPANKEETTVLPNGEKEQVVDADSNSVADVPHLKKGKGKEIEKYPTTVSDDVIMEDAGSRPNNNNNEPHQADGNEAASLLASLTDESCIHPIFLAPKSAHPDRDLGLPDQEAEDVRRLLQLYVQKQEEVCRGTRKLYEGLLRADRLRKTVLAWAKAEAHCGPHRDMSDGEDWYDQEEWGLTEDLKKGQDEEEEDTTQTQKKTRNRNK